LNDTDATTERLKARMAYLGIRETSPTADLLPTRSMPSGLLDPDCRDVAAFLVRLVRRTYARCRRNSRELATRRPDHYGDHQLARWDGGYDWRGRYHAPVWAKIAAAALERGFEVEDYVEAQYALAAGAGSPFPNKLLSSSALERYERETMRQVVRERHVNRGSMEAHFAVEVTRQMTIFGNRGREAAALAVLRNPTNSLRPFFRYWVIAQFDRGLEPYPMIRATYRRPALLQYASSVRAHESAYDHPVLAEFRLAVAMTRLAFAELIADDQAGWVVPPVESAAESRGHGPGAAGE
jgi:hypothetical protein